MTTRPDDDRKPPERAAHGYRNEVSWDGGKGRQPYSNQGQEEQPPASMPEAPEGDRGPHSGENLDQLEQVKRRP